MMGQSHHLTCPTIPAGATSCRTHIPIWEAAPINRRICTHERRRGTSLKVNARTSVADQHHAVVEAWKPFTTLMWRGTARARARRWSRGQNTHSPTRPRTAQGECARRLPHTRTLPPPDTARVGPRGASEAEPFCTTLARSEHMRMQPRATANTCVALVQLTPNHHRALAVRRYQPPTS